MNQARKTNIFFQKFIGSPELLLLQSKATKGWLALSANRLTLTITPHAVLRTNVTTDRHATAPGVFARMPPLTGEKSSLSSQNQSGETHALTRLHDFPYRRD